MKPATRRIFLVNKEDAMFGAKYGDVYKQFKKLNENYNLKSNVNSLENQLKQIEQQTQMLHTNTQEHAKKYDELQKVMAEKKLKPQKQEPIEEDDPVQYIKPPTMQQPWAHDIYSPYQTAVYEKPAPVYEKPTMQFEKSSILCANCFMQVDAVDKVKSFCQSCLRTEKELQATLAKQKKDLIKQGYKKGLKRAKYYVEE